jgi:hypothetical protein
MKQWECEISEKLKHRPVDNKLLLVRSHSTKNQAELRSLLKFALPHVHSCHEEFDSWYDLLVKPSIILYLMHIYTIYFRSYFVSWSTPCV